VTTGGFVPRRGTHVSFVFKAVKLAFSSTVPLSHVPPEMGQRGTAWDRGGTRVEKPFEGAKRMKLYAFEKSV